MTKRFLMLSLLVGLSALSTGCFPRVRQVIANRWHAHHMYGGYGGGACCTPAFKVPAQAGPMIGSPVGCSSCGSEASGIGAGYAPPVIYQGPIQGPSGVPTIGAPTPLLGGGIPGTMPPKQ